jgi:hypothetical protein
MATYVTSPGSFEGVRPSFFVFKAELRLTAPGGEAVAVDKSRRISRLSRVPNNEGLTPRGGTTRTRSGDVAAFTNGYESGTALISTVQLDRSGAPIGPPTLISRSEAPWSEMSLCVLSGSRVAVYSRSAAGPPFENAPRLFMRTLKESVRRRSVR